jgi:hypothetical protein
LENSDDLYWENGNDNPTIQIISDFSNEEKNLIEEDKATQIMSTPKKVISRNVSNSQRRRFK